MITSLLQLVPSGLNSVYVQSSLKNLCDCLAISTQLLRDRYRTLHNLIIAKCYDSTQSSDINSYSNQFVSTLKTKRILTLLLLSYCLLPALALGQTNHKLPFSFTLRNDATTSAGIFDQNGILIKTLWNGVKYQAGTHTETWDGIDDEGQLANDGSYNVKVLSNNVKYEWEGARIGNTSTAISGSTRHKAFQGVYGMAISGNTAYYCTGYDEGWSTSYKFDRSNIQQRSHITQTGQTNQGSTFVATDGNYVYWGGSDCNAPNNSFVYVTKTSDDSEVTDFASGTPLQMTYGRIYSSAIDNVNSSGANVTGMAVMKAGIYLFVARADLGTIRVTNKTTGALVQTISSFTTPRTLVAIDNVLWVISGSNTISKHVINADGTLSAAVLTLSGTVNPLALDVSPDGTLVAICDGNNGSEIIRAYNTSTGAAAWTFGEGSYTTSPMVANDKFFFVDRNQSSNSRFKTFICFAPDGSFWIGDGGNNRMQHYAADRTFIDRIMYMPHSYSVEGIKNDPTRIFNEYMEFAIDYSQPLTSSSGWQLVKNYGGAIPVGCYQETITQVLMSATTLSNGKTYAFLTSAGTYKPKLVEIPLNGPIRLTGVEFDPFASVYLTKEGNLRRYINGGVGGTATVYTRALIDFDSNNDPVWGPESILTSSNPVLNTDPQSYGGGTMGQSTDSGLVVFFDKAGEQFKQGSGYHLGAAKVGDNKWMWKTSKATGLSYLGDFPTDGGFDTGNGVNPSGAGGDVCVLGSHIFWNYHGEFWKQTQTNYWNHFSESGLLIGHFGAYKYSFGEEAIPEVAGNVQGGTVVEVDGNIYLYHNDEGVNGGVHRWKISGLNTIQEQTIGNLVLSTKQGLLAQYFTGDDLDNVNLINSVVTDTIQAYNSPNSVRWTGFVQPLYDQPYKFYAATDKKVRLWINNNLVIDHWDNDDRVEFISNSIGLEAGKKYALRMEISGGSAMLSWSSTNQTKQGIPNENLYAAIAPDVTNGINLNEGLLANHTVDNGLYGWSRNSTVDYGLDSEYGNKWRILTNVRGLNKTAPDANILLRPQTAGLTVTASRNLSTGKTDITQWSITGNITYPSSDFDKGQNKGYLQVLDENNKVIARIRRQEVKNLTDYRIYINNQIALQTSQGELQSLGTVAQPIKLVAANNNLTFQYGNYPAVTTTVFDSTSNWRHPKTLQVLFYSQEQDEHELNMADMKFITSTEVSPLPLTLLSFQAKKTTGQVNLNWDTINETNLASFVVERSDDGYTFSAIAFVHSESTRINHSYNLVDKQYITSTTYYRLKIVDTDTSFTYSPVVAIIGETPELTLYPNPAQSTLRVQYPVSINSYLEIFSILGNKLSHIPLEPGSTAISIDIQSLPQGLFFLQYSNNLFITTKQFAKE
jgi:flagellar hook assembly protein FlgD